MKILTIFHRHRGPPPHHGLTLVEMLLVIGIIGLLAAIVIVAVNPAKQLAQTRDAQRHSDIRTIMEAMYQYSLDHQSEYPVALPVVPTVICRSGVSVSCQNGVNLNALTGAYITALPVDPSEATATGTAYTIQLLPDQRLTIAAPGAELDADISVTR